MICVDASVSVVVLRVHARQVGEVICLLGDDGLCFFICAIDQLNSRASASRVPPLFKEWHAGICRLIVSLSAINATKYGMRVQQQL